jgi:4-alpha-glucanotransferase
MRNVSGKVVKKIKTHFYCSVTFVSKISLDYSDNEKCFRQSCRENQNTLLLFSNFCFENHAFHDTVWKNMVESVTPQVTI